MREARHSSFNGETKILMSIVKFELPGNVLALSFILTNQVQWRHIFKPNLIISNNFKLRVIAILRAELSQLSPERVVKEKELMTMG